MKTFILTLTLSLAGLTLWAQLPPPAAPASTNSADMIRRKLREARLAAQATNPPPATVAPVAEPATVPPPSDELPSLSSTNLPTGDAFAQATAAAMARTNKPTTPKVFSMPRGTNSANLPLGTGTNVVVTPAGTNGFGNPANQVMGTTANPGTLGASGVAPGTAVEAPEPIIQKGDIRFPDTDITQVLEIYAELVGRTVLRGPQLGAGKVSLNTVTALTKSEAIQALDTILAMNGVTMINVGTKFVKAVPVGEAGTAGDKFSTRDPKNLPEADQYITQVVQLNYARPSEMISALQPFAKIPNSIIALDSSGTLIIRDYSANVKRMLELIKTVDTMAPMDFDSEVIPIRYALASDIASALGSIGGGTGASVGRSGSGGGLGAGGLGSGGRSGFGASGLGSGGLGTPGGMGTPGGLGAQSGFGNPGGIGGGGANPRTSTFSDRLSSLVNRAASSGEFRILGQTKIIADERTNSLLIFAAKQDMTMIKDIIKKLDVVLAQVLIEAIIMEVNLSDNKNFGVSYLQTQQKSVGGGSSQLTGLGGLNNPGFLNTSAFGSGTNGSAALASGLSYFGNLGGNFDITAVAAASDSRVNILSRPRIQTSHAVTASLQVGETIPYVTGTYYNGLSGGPSSQYQQLFVGINLQVTPLINPDGLVVMDIIQDIQDLDGSTAISGIGNVPNTSKRTASAKVSVKDRDTIILGGFISSHKARNKSGVPFLKDIPVLGYLFNNTSSSASRTELMVLIRPTVLPSPESAALQARTEVGKSPALKGAAVQDRLDDNKRQKEADKIKVPANDDFLAPVQKQ